eukprot:comp21846_c0_seq2/m.49374 comp21846_c0_seq2/g.49374  ORF comp21846_c0_seq2/g.49374 comp21846_c0_seq2/m.49374 type:complete len:692 (-) comp21846_c0_seq2:862-2937(-)
MSLIARSMPDDAVETLPSSSRSAPVSLAKVSTRWPRLSMVFLSFAAAESSSARSAVRPSSMRARMLDSRVWSSFSMWAILDSTLPCDLLCWPRILLSISVSCSWRSANLPEMSACSRASVSIERRALSPMTTPCEVTASCMVRSAWRSCWCSSRSAAASASRLSKRARSSVICLLWRWAAMPSCDRSAAPSCSSSLDTVSGCCCCWRFVAELIRVFVDVSSERMAVLRCSISARISATAWLLETMDAEVCAASFWVASAASSLLASMARRRWSWEATSVSRLSRAAASESVLRMVGDAAEVFCADASAPPAATWLMRASRARTRSWSRSTASDAIAAFVLLRLLLLGGWRRGDCGCCWSCGVMLGCREGEPGMRCDASGPGLRSPEGSEGETSAAIWLTAAAVRMLLVESGVCGGAPNVDLDMMLFDAEPGVPGGAVAALGLYISTVYPDLPFARTKMSRPADMAAGSALPVSLLLFSMVLITAALTSASSCACSAMWSWTDEAHASRPRRFSRRSCWRNSLRWTYASCSQSVWSGSPKWTKRATRETTAMEPEKGARESRSESALAALISLPGKSPARTTKTEPSALASRPRRSWKRFPSMASVRVLSTRSLDASGIPAKFVSRKTVPWRDPGCMRASTRERPSLNGIWGRSSGARSCEPSDMSMTTNAFSMPMAMRRQRFVFAAGDAGP